MTDAIIIGIDAGTSVIKSVAFDAQGRQLAVAAEPNKYVSFPDGGCEQDMNVLWADVVSTLKGVAAQIPDLASRLAAISVTAQGDGLWMIGADGEPVGPAQIWLDNRAGAIVEDYVRSEHYPAHYERTGTGLTVVQMSGKLAWTKKNRPEQLARATEALHCKDWIYFKLTGERITDPSEGNFTFGNFRTGQYQPDILDHLGLSQEKRLLPPMLEGTKDSRPLSEAAAKAAGLKTGTPVVLGYIDIVCSGLGGGLFDVTGQSGCTVIGSTGLHQRLHRDVSTVKLNAARAGFTVLFPAPGMVAQMQSNMAATLNIDWLLDLARGILSEHGVERSRRDLLDGLDGKVLARDAGRLLYHPYISRIGERSPFMNVAARAGFTGLDQSTDYFDMMRAVFEGLGHAARDCYEAMGPAPREIRIAGGAARSKALRTILASALDAGVRSVAREETGAAGAAMMAAVQQKLFPDMEACAKAWVDPHLGETTPPDPALVERYGKIFPLYVAVRTAMPPVWAGLRQV